MQPITILKPLENNAIIYNFDFYPNQNLLDFKNAIHSDILISDDNLKNYIIYAMAVVNQDLKSLEKKADKLTDLTTKTINNLNLNEYYYKQALINYAHHLILEDFSSYDLANDKKEKSDYSLDKSDRLKARSRTFVKFLLEQNRATIELI